MLSFDLLRCLQIKSEDLQRGYRIACCVVVVFGVHCFECKSEDIPFLILICTSRGILCSFMLCVNADSNCTTIASYEAFVKKQVPRSFSPHTKTMATIALSCKATHFLSEKAPTWWADRQQRKRSYCPTPLGLPCCNPPSRITRVSYVLLSECVCVWCVCVRKCVRVSVSVNAKLKTNELYILTIHFGFSSSCLYIEY